jgi:rRNA maturation protein Nop10
MAARFFNPEELQQWAQEDPPRLLDAALTQIGQLQQRSRQLKEALQRVADLEKALAEAQAAACRQAAPFRVPLPKRVANPKPPGRKAGHPGSFRPRPSYIDEAITVELEKCQHCGAQDWAGRQEVEQFIEDVPEIRPHVTHLRTFVGTCGCCGKRTHSRHPLAGLRGHRSRLLPSRAAGPRDRGRSEQSQGPAHP